MIELKCDETILDQIWGNWDSHDLTIEELLKSTNNILDHKVLSEIWHLISLKALKNTEEHAYKAIKDGNDLTWLHDNVLFGSGRVLLDFNKRIHGSPLYYYRDYVVKNPTSLVARRILIEVLIEHFLIDEALVEIEVAITDFIDKQIYFKIYKCKIDALMGKRKTAISTLEEYSIQEMKYQPLLNVAEALALLGCYGTALSTYEKAYKAQEEGNRKIDTLLSQIHILRLLKRHENTSNLFMEIYKIYKDDYDQVDGDEIEEIKKLQLTIAST